MNRKGKLDGSTWWVWVENKKEVEASFKWLLGRFLEILRLLRRVLAFAFCTVLFSRVRS